MKATGCHPSKYDKRTFQHTTKAVPLTIGGIIYQPQDIEDQDAVGICTAIDETNEASKVYGKRYSADFHYLLQKKFIDGAWGEGSSLLSSKKVGNKYGFLPTEFFPYITQADRQGTYASYITKLLAISDTEIQRLLTLCEHKLVGYARVEPTVYAIAQALLEHPFGITCRYEVGNEWWTDANGVTYDSARIDPLKAPKQSISGHSIKATYFDFNKSPWLLHANTWGTTYDLQGNCHIGYLPTEAWVSYYDTTPKYIFNSNLSFGTRSIDVKQLQIRLGMSTDNQTGYYGLITASYVLAYQVAHGIFPTDRFSCGPKTRASLNS